MELVFVLTIVVVGYLAISRALYPFSIEGQGYRDGFAAASRSEEKNPLVAHSSYIDHYYKGYQEGRKHTVVV